MRQAISTLPESFIGQNSCAEIDISADGKSVYASNRGHDSIAIFLLGHDGQLISKGHVASGGKTPRNFSIDPSGMFIVVANQESDLITILRRNPSDGKLTQTGKFIHSGTPMRIAMARFDI